MDRYIFIIMLLACVLRLVRCYSSGKVTESCAGMTPQHGVGAQQILAQFSVTTDRISFKEGDEIIVSLLAGSTPFIGFMIQATEVGGSSPLGSFTVTSREAQLLTCNGLPNSAVSHTSNSPKSSIQGIWRAPTSGKLNSIQFSASFVKDYSNFWVGVRSSPVTYNIAAAPPANSTSIPITSTTSSASKAHVSLMTLSVAATIVAFIMAFSEIGGWSGGAHPVLGCVVMILALFQPIAAMFRCGPHHHWRFLFSWSHALNAVAIKGLAVAAIFTGLSYLNTIEDNWLLKVMGGFVGWEATL